MSGGAWLRHFCSVGSVCCAIARPGFVFRLTSLCSIQSFPPVPGRETQAHLSAPTQKTAPPDCPRETWVGKAPPFRSVSGLRFCAESILSDTTCSLFCALGVLRTEFSTPTLLSTLAPCLQGKKPKSEQTEPRESLEPVTTKPRKNAQTFNRD